MTDFASLYAFLARAYHAPPDADFLALAADAADLGAQPIGVLAERFTWLFEFNVYPYASVFLDPSGMLNAPWSAYVTGVYSALGLEVKAAAGLAAGDHIAAQLEALGILCEREYAATTDLERLRARRAQSVLLLEHVLPWLPAFVAAVQRIDAGFYGDLAGLTLELGLAHADTLLDAPAPPFVFPDGDEDEPAPLVSTKKPLPAARTELRYYLTPARSGWFLSREDLRALAGELDLPLRFAERVFMLEQLLSAAAAATRLGDLFSHMEGGCRVQQEAYARLQQDVPGLAPVYETWVAKLGVTRERLLALAAEE